ncbi:MAG: archaemetzincin family Zn-dependent metalloprotease, partial [bacterium]
YVVLPYIYVSPVGVEKIDNIFCILEELEKIFLFPFKVGKFIECPVSAFDPVRKQYYTSRILQILINDFPNDGLKLVGITNVDLCTPVLTYVFGEAQLDGRVAIVSMHRLNQNFYNLPDDKELLYARLKKTLIHELGHCFGLVHCDDPRCVMFLADSIFTLDYKKGGFCLRCDDFLNSKLSR